MAQADKSQRTEPPTLKKMRKAYEDGNVPRSQEVGQSISLAVFLGWAYLYGPQTIEKLRMRFEQALSESGAPNASDRALLMTHESAMGALLLLMPLLGLLTVSGVVGQVAQTGYHPRKQPIPFELKKLDPVKGLKKIVSPEKIVAALKAIVRVAIYTLLAAWVILPAWGEIALLPLVTPAQILSTAAALSADLLLRALLVGLVLMIADFGFTRYRWYRNLYMTKQEVKDDVKESEGDPAIRGRIRARQKELTRRRMIEDVKNADVVVTNPTHVAVALKYEQGTMIAPLVLAKGRNRIAEKIKEQARKHDIPTVEDPPLARALEKMCKVGAPIPESMFRAVSEIFAYIYKKRRPRGKRR